MFLHLRTHSYYSFLRGVPSPAELAATAAQYGMPALGLTDYHGLTGAVEFYDACQEVGVRPILGLEVETAAPAVIQSAESGTLLFLAMDMTGWGSLCRLSSHLSSLGSVSTFERVAQDAEGLICLAGGRRSLLARMILHRQNRAASIFVNRLLETFPGNLYIEMQNQVPEDEMLMASLAALARNFKLPVVATQDVYYLRRGQDSLQRILSAIRLNRAMDDLPSDTLALPNSYFTTEDEMGILFENFPQALATTQEIAERCQLELPLGVPHFPEVSSPPGMTALQTLRIKAEEGARKLYGAPPGHLPDDNNGTVIQAPKMIPLEVQNRLDHELSVIGECGYASLFLIMEEILSYARKIGVPFSSRGSAASSLVAHCLGITSPDPIHLNLYFERFLNPARATPPDIDTDLCSRRRDEVIHFVYERFGQDRVATVCTINRFRNRSALREVAKAYGLPQSEVDALTNSLPHRWFGPPEKGEKEAPFKELVEQYRSEIHQAIFRDAAAILDLPDHLSVHPGGVVIAPGKLTDLVPTQMASKGVLITQFDLNSIERLGLVKIDLLGIRGLTVMGDVAKAIYQNRSQEGFPFQFLIDKLDLTPLDILDSIPEDDPETSEIIQSGRTIGCFQIESPGMRATLKEIQARNIEDILVALALYRPGPLTGGLKDSFVRRHRHQEPDTQIHPALEPLLKDTHGVILYQEQVLRIAHELAGFNLADADLLRRAMSHFDPGKQMQILKEKFIAGASRLHAIPEATSEKVWELMAAFAGYGFPKAHAASYAQISWRSAWCKTHYPAIFMASVMANWGGYYSQRVYLTEARRMGLVIQPPNVNFAEREFSVKYLDKAPVLFMGLDQVRDLTQRTQNAILHTRPFHSFVDFLTRVDPRPIEADNLVKVGALVDFGYIPGMLHQLSSGNWRGGQLPLFTFSEIKDSDQMDDWSLQSKVDAQEEILGVSVIAHPLELAAGKIAEVGALTTMEAAANLNKRVRVAGMRQTWRRSRTNRGEYVYFMSLEDLEGFLNVVIYSDVYRRNRTEISGPGPYIIEGQVELDREQGEPFIRAERIWRLE